MELEQKKDNISERSYGVAVCLTGIFGVLGIHHFYLGNIAHGIFDFSLFVIFLVLFYGWGGEYALWSFLFFGLDFIHTVFVFFKLLVGAETDGQGKIVAYPNQFKV